MKVKPLSDQHAKYLLSQKRYSASVILSQLGLLFGSLLIWEALAQFGLIDVFITSCPSKIFTTILKTFATGNLLKHILVSTYETVIGFLLGTLLGTGAAVALWWSQFLSDVLEPYVVVLNSLPKIALGPLIILWAGTGTASIITMAVLVSVVVTTITMLNGFYQTNESKILLLKTMNASKGQVFLKLVFPYNIPTLVSALKINVGMAWVGTIMGEYLVSRAGLGYLIIYGGQTFKLDLVMSCVIILCALAGVMYFGVSLLEKTIVKWKE